MDLGLETHPKEIRRIKRKGPLKKFLTIAIPIVVFIVANIVFWSWIASSYPNEQEEVARYDNGRQK